MELSFIDQQRTPRNMAMRGEVGVYLVSDTSRKKVNEPLTMPAATVLYGDEQKESPASCSDAGLKWYQSDMDDLL
jgi:hypothetical protein